LSAEPVAKADVIGFQDRAGKAWVRFEAQLDLQLEPLGRLAMDKLGLSASQSVIDVGCGTGQTLMELARRVGEQGKVLGVDPSQPMLARAKERVRALPQVELAEADAERFAFTPGGFDAVFSRFGVMFFDDHVAAFRNFANALRPRGRLAFVCWQAWEKNEWAAVTLEATRRVAPWQELPSGLRPEQRNGFYLSDPAKLTRMLADGGFAAEIEPVQTRLHFGAANTLTEAVDYALAIGPAARIISEADAALKPAFHAELERALQPFVSAQGVWLGAAALVVSATLG
jgi:ubiquinone/menaquinone biosynthesis C-methylase UbiE